MNNVSDISFIMILLLIITIQIRDEFLKSARSIVRKDEEKKKHPIQYEK